MDGLTNSPGAAGSDKRAFMELKHFRCYTNELWIALATWTIERGLGYETGISNSWVAMILFPFQAAIDKSQIASLILVIRVAELRKRGRRASIV
jgi:hypothetical protein